MNKGFQPQPRVVPNQVINDNFHRKARIAAERKGSHRESQRYYGGAFEDFRHTRLNLEV